VKDTTAREALEHIHALLHAPEAPELPLHLAGDPILLSLHKELLDLRYTLLCFSDGNFSCEIPLDGYVGCALQTLQAVMLHLIRQVLQVAEGDLSQRVELGEFSVVFNSMLHQMKDSLTHLKRKETELTQLADSLSREVEVRSAAMKALSRSEATFKYLAGHDPLTEVMNRRAFLEAIRDKAQAAADAELSCSLALLDVDNFKQFNDTHGHQAGDIALQTLVKVATKELRLSDIMARFGGEEFIFFFPGAGISPAHAACERIRRAIAQKPMVWNCRELPLTVSIGLTEIPSDWKTPRDDIFLRQIISTADKALYKAKEEGRDRVVALVDGEPGLNRPVGQPPLPPSD
jgi:diguanylate cyclase (GGDEF)-like protein